MTPLFSNKNHCPIIRDPLDDCYCIKMNSLDIDRAVNLCSKNFKLCEIYKRNSEELTAYNPSHATT